jgi:hypothetical protein
MGEKVDTVTIPKLTESNHIQWRFHVNLVIKQAKLSDIVNGTTARPTANPEDWDARDCRAQNIIASTLTEKQANLIYQCATACEMWTKIEAAHNDNSEFTKQTIWAKYHTFKVVEGGSLVEAYGEIESMVTQLRSMGETISDSRVT